MTKPSKNLRLLVSRVVRDGKSLGCAGKVKEGMTASDIREVIKKCAEESAPILEIDFKVTDVEVEPLPEDDEKRE